MWCCRECDFQELEGWLSACHTSRRTVVQIPKTHMNAEWTWQQAWNSGLLGRDRGFLRASWLKAMQICKLWVCANTTHREVEGGRWARTRSGGKYSLQYPTLTFIKVSYREEWSKHLTQNFCHTLSPLADLSRHAISLFLWYLSVYFEMRFLSCWPQTAGLKGSSCLSLPSTDTTV